MIHLQETVTITVVEKTDHDFALRFERGKNEFAHHHFSKSLTRPELELRIGIFLLDFLERDI